MLISSQRLIIVADDLTGAADSAARAGVAGLHAEVWLPGAQVTVLGAQVTALSSDSRHLPAQAAAERVRQLIAPLAAVPGLRWYKKIDSTLRGNIAAELSALLDALGLPQAVIAPAFPAQGRGLHHGALVGPAFSGTTNLLTLLRAGGEAVGGVPLEVVRAGAAGLACQLRVAASSARLVVCDALSDSDLQAIGRAATAALPDALLCGSAGLIGALVGSAPRGASAPLAPRSGAAGRALIVVGSGSPRAHAQIAHLCAAGAYALTYPAASIMPDTHADLLLHLPPPSAYLQLDSTAGRMVAHGLAVQACALLERYNPALLVLVGGDTARSVLSQLGIERLQIKRELLPGVPLAYGLDRHGVERRVVLKAGSFGDDHVLATILRLVRDRAVVA